VLPLHADASAQIQPVSLLGERFVALKPGTRRRRLRGRRR